MLSLHTLVPDPEVLLSLSPEELAGVILEHLHSLHPQDQRSLNRYSFSLTDTYREFPDRYHKQIARALMEAWSWLEREGLIAEAPEQNNDWYFVTRRGALVKSRSDLAAYRNSSRLPKGQLHPTIAQKCWAMFVRGEYDTAVFQAFKELEVAIREAAHYGPEDYGVPMARKAFDPARGPLTDHAAPGSERESLMHLVAGAIGCYKNPHSHRHVALGADESVEMIFLASHLLKIADARAARRADEI